MGQAGRIYLEQNFSRTAIAGKLLELMENIVKGKSSNRNQ
jgi:hypothetical protein